MKYLLFLLSSLTPLSLVSAQDQTTQENSATLPFAINQDRIFSTTRIPSSTDEETEAWRVATRVKGYISYPINRQQRKPQETLTIDPDNPIEIRIQTLPFADRYHWDQAYLLKGFKQLLADMVLSLPETQIKPNGIIPCDEFYAIKFLDAQKLPIPKESPRNTIAYISIEATQTHRLNFSTFFLDAQHPYIDEHIAALQEQFVRLATASPLFPVASPRIIGAIRKKPSEQDTENIELVVPPSP